jgi:hypothetical protein
VRGITSRTENLCPQKQKLTVPPYLEDSLIPLRSLGTGLIGPRKCLGIGDGWPRAAMLAA